MVESGLQYPMAGKSGKKKTVDPEAANVAADGFAEAIAALRSEIDTLRAEFATLRRESPSGEAPPQGKPKAKRAGLPPVLDDAATARAVRLGAGFSTPVRVALIQVLLHGGKQPVADIGTQVGVTTGSLYHNLRELIHAGIAVQVDKTHYELTAAGREAATLLFQLVA